MQTGSRNGGQRRCLSGGGLELEIVGVSDGMANTELVVVHNENTERVDDTSQQKDTVMISRNLSPIGFSLGLGDLLDSGGPSLCANMEDNNHGQLLG